MSPSEVALIVVGALALAAVVLLNLAQRVDRLHRRVLRSRAVLEAQLVRRAEAAAVLAAGGGLDPASAVIVGTAAWECAVQAPRLVEGDPGELGDPASERGLAESQLSVDLRAALGTAQDRDAMRTQPGVASDLDALERASYRAQLARRFHNDAVVASQRLRRNALVRAFRLAGRAPMPVTVEMDDEVLAAAPVDR